MYEHSKTDPFLGILHMKSGELRGWVPSPRILKDVRKKHRYDLFDFKKEKAIK